MRDWLFRIFFRDVADRATAEVEASQRALDEERADHRRTRERLDAVLCDRDKLWQTMEQALAGERYALHSQANYFSQRAGGGVPYPDAHKMESPTLNQPGGPVGAEPRVLPSQRAEAARQNAIKHIVENDLAKMFVQRT